MMDYKEAWLSLAAQVRRLGYVADVQEDDDGVYFGDDEDARQTRMAILATVAWLRYSETQIVVDKSDIPF